MKALSLTQPWGTLVAIGAKRFETRSFATKYRGILAIHAAKTMPRYAKDFIATNRRCRQALNGYGIRVGPMAHPETWIPMGQIVAVCQLVACVQVTDYTRQHGAWIEAADSTYHITLPPNPPELEFGDYSDGRWVWVLDENRPLPKPIPAKGALGLWEWTPPDGFSV